MLGCPVHVPRKTKYAVLSGASLFGIFESLSDAEAVKAQYKSVGCLFAEIREVSYYPALEGQVTQ